MRWVLAFVAACSVPPFAGSDDGGGGHDEDGDGIADADDPCPQIASPAGSHDTDGDGIGDDCDPFPNDAADSKRFYSFTGTTGDLSRDGSMVITANTLDIGGSADVTDLVWVPNDFTYVRVDVGFDVAFVAGGMDQQITIHTRHPSTGPTNDDGGQCDLVVVDATTMSIVVKQALTTLMSASIAHGLNGLSAQLSVVQNMTGGLRCTLDGGATGEAVATPNSGTGQVGFSTHGVQVRLHYLFVAGR